MPDRANNLNKHLNKPGLIYSTTLVNILDNMTKYNDRIRPHNAICPDIIIGLSEIIYLLF